MDMDALTSPYPPRMSSPARIPARLIRFAAPAQTAYVRPQPAPRAYPTHTGTNP
ncbi:hypothetical protein EXIGLDRAFT_737464 [Exidia glandulosa HHB12029]|uniref:Uncharacterized protein n=1 Tax=Exidia glandulosa HHB12029 TaxID=1314781 RepID=A0A165Z1G2_EXIGL|nr:hypothetical protein EXIGLDRAFT_737464 [Exidia glandulosa HHB12029]